MELDDFTFGINRLQRFFKKKLDTGQEDEYFQRIKYIPQEVFVKAIDDLIDTSRYFPTPGDLKLYWTHWQITNPEKMYAEPEYCEDCQGEGILRIKIKKNNKDYTHIVRCGSCKNWKNEFGTWMSKRTHKELERKGLEIISNRKWSTGEERYRDNIENMVPF